MKKKHMKLRINVKGAVDIANNQLVGGSARNFETKNNFLRELKEQNIIEVDWVKREEDKADVLRKNVAGTSFDKFLPDICGYDAHVN